MEASDTTPQNASAEDMLRELLTEQAQQREHLANLRSQLEAHKVTPPSGPVVNPQTPEQLYEARMEQIGQAPFYCPGCGALYGYQRECRGRAEAPHQPIDVIGTDELRSGDPSRHTAAPSTANLG